MSVYIVSGKLGQGKTLAAVGRIRDYLQQGRQVATNLDLNLDKLVKPSSRMHVTRLPDKPRPGDLVALGTGDGRPVTEYDEQRFGLVVLDELASWLNSRSWNDKERAELLEWFIHARKYHWDVILIVQSVTVIDKQLREMLCENLVVCKRLDRFMVPLIGPIVKYLTGFKLKFPKAHVGTVYDGDNETGYKVDRWWYRGKDLYGAYQTGQVFALDQLHTDKGPIDMRASYTLLSAWHVHGRYLEPRGIGQLLLQGGAYLVKVVVWGIVVAGARVTGRSPVAQARRWGMMA